MKKLIHFFFTVFYSILLGQVFAQNDITVKSHFEINNMTSPLTGLLDPGGQFGFGITNLGDLDGDGFEDLAVTANIDDDGGAQKGAIWILFLQKQSIKAVQKISMVQGGFTGTLDHSFGVSIANIGDLDGDGVTDIAVGESGCDDGGINRGAVWILFLNTDGTVKAHQKISQLHGGFAGVLTNDCRFGGAGIANTGDLDGDGVADIAVGTIFDPDGGFQTGAVWILFLNVNGTVKNQQKISALHGNFSGILDTGDHFGTDISSIGDFNNDGINDIVVTARHDDDGGVNTGAAWILLLDIDGTIKMHYKISNLTAGFTNQISSGDCFGISASSIGDMDGDGVTDLMFGAYLDDDGGQDRGAIWLLNMNANGTVKKHHKINSTQGGFSGTLNNGDLFGSWGLATLSDFDSDGHKDIVVSHNYSDIGGYNTGAIWVLNLQGQPYISTSTAPSITENRSIIVYPNPNKGQFTISKIPSKNATIRVWTIKGELVHNLIVQTHLEEVEVFVENSGIYLVEVLAGEERFVKKVIVYE